MPLALNAAFTSISLDSHAQLYITLTHTLFTNIFHYREDKYERKQDESRMDKHSVIVLRSQWVVGTVIGLGHVIPFTIPVQR